MEARPKGRLVGAHGGGNRSSAEDEGSGQDSSGFSFDPPSIDLLDELLNLVIIDFSTHLLIYWPTY